MFPILVPIPVITNTYPGYTCCFPNKNLLTIISVVLVLLVTPILIFNVIDNSGFFELAFLLLLLFVVFTLLFDTIGFIGMLRLNKLMLTVAYWLWLVTWTMFLAFTIFSGWNTDTMKMTSIKGRCPISLWIFPWCRGAIMTLPPPNSTSSLRNAYRLPNIKSDGKTNYSNEAHDAARATNIQMDVMFKNVLGLNVTDEQKISTNESKYATKTKRRAKRSVTDIGVSWEYPEGPEYRKAVAQFLGIVFVLLSTIALYTLYGVALDDFLKQLTQQRTDSAARAAENAHQRVEVPQNQ